MKAIFLSLLALQPGDYVAAEQVDVIEVNHLYDDYGQRQFTQVIYKDWDGDRHQVRAWRMLNSPGMWPNRQRAIWMDGGILRDVRCRSVAETWTQFDPEIEERKIIPPDSRPGLAGEKRKFP